MTRDEVIEIIDEMLNSPGKLSFSALSWIKKIDNTVGNSSSLSFTPRQYYVIIDIYNKFKRIPDQHNNTRKIKYTSKRSQLDIKTKNRLIGVNNLLSDLNKKEIFISQILTESGFSESQIETIRRKHLKKYLKIVTYKIYNHILQALSKREVTIINFCYYLDGRFPKLNRSSEKHLKIAMQRVSQLQSEVIINLRETDWLTIFKKIISSSAKAILENESMRMKHRLKLIKKSHERIKRRNKIPHELLERSSNEISEKRKKELLKLASMCKAPDRVIEQHRPKRIMSNPWLGATRHKSNWW